MLVLLLTLATAAVPAPTTVAQERAAQRDACARLRTDPATPASRAAFKACVARIRYDGDLPPKATR